VPVLIAGGVAVTVASIGAWILNEEARVIEAKTKLVRAIGDEARKATDPEVARKIAGIAERLDPNAAKGPSWLWLVPVAIAVPLVPAIIKRVKAERDRDRLSV